MGGRRKLSEQQLEMVDRVRDAAKAVSDREAWVEQMRRAEVDPLIEKRDRAVAEAVDAGVPKTWLHTHDVLGTVNPYSVISAMERHAARQHVTRQPDFAEIGNGKVRVHIEAFPTTSMDPGYPETLSGILSPDAAAPSGWAVDWDPSDIGTEGEEDFLPGALRWEVEFASGVEDSLVGRLEAWLATQQNAAA